MTPGNIRDKLRSIEKYRNAKLRIYKVPSYQTYKIKK